MYVGKIPAGVRDSLVRALLGACGGVRSWKRVMDPEKNTPKRFGGVGEGRGVIMCSAGFRV